MNQWCANESVWIRSDGNEGYISLNLITGISLQLNETSYCIWKMAVNGLTEREICDAIRSDVIGPPQEIDAEALFQIVCDHVDLLRQAELLVPRAASEEVAETFKGR